MQTTSIKDPLPGGDMRTRYVPDVRFRSGLLRMAPWLDIALVILYLLLLHSRIVLQPGVVVELPDAQPGAGLASPLIAVALVSGPPRAPVYRVFFDNVQYALDDEKRLEALRAALAEKRIHLNETALTLYADRRIEHHHLMRLMQLAQEAGMQRINLGTQPVDAQP